MSAGPQSAPADLLALGTPISGALVLRLPGGRTLRVHRRSAAVTALLVLVATAAATTALVTGAYGLSVREALATLTGSGSPTARFIVVDQRLPRALAAVAVGAALGASGAIFQSLSRNPLGSPDVVGFTTGSATGGLLVLLLASAPPALGVGTGAVLGGLATALVVALLSASRGLAGQQLVLVGLAVGAMLASVNDYLLVRADLEAAEAARAWQFGSLNVISWSGTVPACLTAVVLLPLALLVARPLAALELGDDLAAALGVSTARRRLVLLVVGVLLAGVAVATAGPIAFVALAAPQLARRLARAPGAALVPSAAMGAALLGAADLLAQELLSPFQIPVGLVTGALGGLYLLALLSRRER